MLAGASTRLSAGPRSRVRTTIRALSIFTAPRWRRAPNARSGAVTPGRLDSRTRPERWRVGGCSSLGHAARSPMNLRGANRRARAPRRTEHALPGHPTVAVSIAAPPRPLPREPPRVVTSGTFSVGNQAESASLVRSVARPSRFSSFARLQAVVDPGPMVPCFGVPRRVERGGAELASPSTAGGLCRPAWPPCHSLDRLRPRGAKRMATVAPCASPSLVPASAA
jgi:hypothetical protein